MHLELELSRRPVSADNLRLLDVDGDPLRPDGFASATSLDLVLILPDFEDFLAHSRVQRRVPGGSLGVSKPDCTP